MIEEVLDIIGHHHHPRPEETTNFKILYDADMIVNLEENQKESKLAPGKLTAMIDRNFLTESGRKIARKIFLATEVTVRQSRNQKTSATEGTEITEKLAIKNEQSL